MTRAKINAKADAFTMIELLAVLAVAGVLLGLVLPLASGARRQYMITETKARFQRWSLGLEQFRAEYGAYPLLGASPIVVNTPPGRMAELLSGRGLQGGAMIDPVARQQNPRQLSFVVWTSPELTSDGQLQDAFGQTEITLYLDADSDGFLDTVTPPVRGRIGWQSTGAQGTFHSWR